MNSRELVSVIVPVFNVEGYLPKCLDTIARQTYSNLEIILVDDGSTDSSGEICDKFAEQDSRAVVFHHEKNKKLWATRNTGQAAAHGEYIMFVDGDDYIHLDTIRIMHEAINRDGRYDLAIIRSKITTSANEDIVTERSGDYVQLAQSEVMDVLFNSYSFVYVWNKLYRRAVIEGLWAHAYERAQDIDYSFRSYLRIKNAIWIKKQLYYYVQRKDSAIHKPGSELLGLKCVVRLLFDNAINLPDDKKEYRHYLLRKLFEKMIVLIGMTWNTPESKTTISQCRQYEKTLRRDFWGDPHLGFTLKTALFLNVRHPYCIRFLKRLTGYRLSWSLIRRF